MFKCEDCGESFNKPNRVVTKVRMVNHRAVVVDRKTREVRQVVMGRGTQIVEEKNLCPLDANRVFVQELAGEPEEVRERVSQPDETDYTAIAEFEDGTDTVY